MKKHTDYPTWFLWLIEHGFSLFVVGGLMLMVAIVLASVYIDHRLDQIEEQIQYVPPSSYQAPNLDDFAAGDIPLDELAAPRMVYAPVYSHIYYQGGAPFLLETTLSIRNVDLQQPIYVNSIEYLDTEGKPVKSHLDRTIKLDPMQTIEFLVESRDSTGGSGANFLIEWAAREETDQPLVETVMVGTSGSQAICFSRTGVEITLREEQAPAE